VEETICKTFLRTGQRVVSAFEHCSLRIPADILLSCYQINLKYPILILPKLKERGVFKVASFYLLASSYEEGVQDGSYKRQWKVGLSRYCSLNHFRKQIYSVSPHRKMLNLSDLSSKFHIIVMFVTTDVKCATHNGYVCLGSASYRYLASVPHQLWLPNRKPRISFETLLPS